MCQYANCAALCGQIIHPQMTRMTQIFKLEHRVTETQSFYKFSLCLCGSVFFIKRINPCHLRLKNEHI